MARKPDIAGRASARIAAPVADCVALLRAVEAYPRWYDTLDGVRRLDGDRVEVDVALPFTSVRLVFELRDDLPSSLEGLQVDGDGRIVDAAMTWQLVADGEGTVATYAFSAVAASRTLRLALRAPATRRLVEHDLVHGFPEALKRTAEGVRPL